MITTELDTEQDIERTWIIRVDMSQSEKPHLRRMAQREGRSIRQQAAAILRESIAAEASTRS